MWWHLLSLDAPCVAVLWTAFLAHQAGVALPLRVPATLGLAVWYVYAGDRISDAFQGRAAEERHGFHKEHQRAFAFAALAAAPMLVLLIAWLPPAIRVGWLLLSLPLIAYFLAVHLVRFQVTKEPLVAVFFAAGAGLPVLLQRNSLGHLAAWSLVGFGCVCWLNCVAVARWEGSLRAADPATAWLGDHFQVAAALTICTALPLLVTAQTAPIAWATVTAAGCLLLLDMSREHLESTALRALADASLLTPLVAWPLAKLLMA